MADAELALVRISIHALREEGDGIRKEDAMIYVISIHALREEGDERSDGVGDASRISIHALREEGDRWTPCPPRPA